MTTSKDRKQAGESKAATTRSTPPKKAPAKPKEKRSVPIMAIAFAGIAVVAVIAVVFSGGTSLGSEYGDPTVTGEALPLFTDTANDQAIGLPAPEVVGTDFDGTTVTIANDGRAKAIGFFAHWCPHCQVEVPRVTEWLAAGGGVEGVDMYSVATSMNSARENYPSSEWLEREEWPVAVIADDQEGTVHLNYGAGGFPFWVFVDAAGNVVARTAGQLEIPTLEGLMQIAAGSDA
jgi:thiol-disulfide isomerase/thioredoxin